MEVALVQVDVAHDHHVDRVTEDPAQPFDLTATSQTLGGEGVAEFVA
ncbi:MAG TPA: hypothetical protein VJT78_14805 [Candidatus Dormibacteraeota bacterium]|nr:hypothetical protein [Candidatus Dormibacteraeota bacterium]